MSDNASKKHTIIIQCAKNDYSCDLSLKLKSLSSIYPCKYFSIVHDKDINEDGTFKNKHIHLVVSFATKIRKKTLLNVLSKVFNADLDAITIDKVFNFSSCVQYLFHLNNSDKYQYNFNECVTNCPDELQSIVSISPISQCDFEGDLFNLCLLAPSKIYVVKKIGMAKYSAYSKAIDVIFNERDKFLNS